jgi:uncharacterized protein YkwD
MTMRIKTFLFGALIFLIIFSIPVSQGSAVPKVHVEKHIVASWEDDPLVADREFAPAYAYPPDPISDIDWSSGTNGVADIQAAFNNARTVENGQLGTSLPMMTLPSQTEWNGMNDGAKALWLINRERIDRGVAPLDGLETNVTAVAQYYANYLLDNNTWGHTADGRSPWERLNDNPTIGACHDFLSIAENLAVFVTSGSSIPLPIERSIYMWMYDDSGSAWGHRHAILWYPYNDNSSQPGQEGFLGIGRANGGPYKGPFSQTWPFAEMIVMNVFDPCAAWSTSLVISGNTSTAGVVLNYTDDLPRSIVSQADGTYSLQVTDGWSGTVTPTHNCYTFDPPSRTYDNVIANQLNQNYTAIFNPASGCADIEVTVGEALVTSKVLENGESRVETYPGINGGPVVVKNTTGAPTIASYLQYRRPGSSGGWTGITQTMALTDAQISDRYAFPHYDYTDPTRYNSLQLANFDAVPTDIIVEIGGVQQGSSIPLGVGQSQNVTFSGVKGGPIVVYSDNGADIVATLYELKRATNTGSWTGQTTMMGLPWSQLSDTYVIPRYNYTLQDLLPFVVFANTDSLPTTVTVTIGGVLRGTYNLAVGEGRVETYPGVNGGPVVVQSDNGAPIIASYLQYRRPGSSGGWTGITQTMALTDAQITDRYAFPYYDYTDPTRYNSLQIANFDTLDTEVVIEIGGVERRRVPLAAGSSTNETFSGLAGGPIVVYSANGADIVVTLYELKRPSTSSSWTGQTTMMGLPWTQLSDTYVIPRYNYTLQDLLPFVVFGVP